MSTVAIDVLKRTSKKAPKFRGANIKNPPNHFEEFKKLRKKSIEK